MAGRILTLVFVFSGMALSVKHEAYDYIIVGGNPSSPTLTQRI
jgi:hypothetical protein